MKRLWNKFNSVRSEAGNVAVTVALSMVVMTGMAGLAIDGGRMYMEKSRLQKALDAAVLAGAQKVAVSQTEAISVAKQISGQNAYTLADSEITEISNQSIKAQKTVHVPTTFANVLGIASASVTAKAKAAVSYVSKIGKGNVAPIGVENVASYFDGGSHIVSFPKSGNHPTAGMAGYVDFDNQGGGGGQNLSDQISNGYNGYVEIGQTVLAQSGSPTPALTALKDLVALDAGKAYCQQPSTADHTCARVIYVPILNSWSGLKIVGFGAFWIDTVQSGGNGKGGGTGNNADRLTGQFLKLVAPGDVGVGAGGGINSGLSTIKLVE
ncbi:pilus assembly protein TadG-related protein [Ectobacillus ponti]|uniref:Tad domain-containing protein n=1 Tax=Ectobacillus ponti TaxID=2961894 RepID=A0AA41XAL6_9BACI|nr:pilus assembly protein TadG-related protein [Ectobacillus ponti]MCP8969323.1 Tad domain-containing protein [Ectobacillus ponti]